MTFADILNADVNDIGLKIREGFDWWVDELGSIARPLKSRARRGPVAFAERQADGSFRIRRPGLPDQRHLSVNALSAALVLPSASALVRRLPKPTLPDRDIRRMIVLDLDRLTPFSAQHVYHDVVIEPAADGGDKGVVRLAVALRSQVDTILAEARMANIEPSAVVIAGEEGVFDFLPAMRSSGAPRGPGRFNVLWAVVAVLLALNVGLAIWRDVRDLDSIKAAVATQQPLVGRIQALRAELRDQSAQARAAQRSNGEPLRVLNAASLALPDTAWVQRFSWDGASVRLVGTRQDGVDVVGALRRAPIFSNVRETDSSSSVVNAFDVVADVRPAANPVDRR